MKRLLAILAGALALVAGFGVVLTARYVST